MFSEFTGFYFHSSLLQAQAAIFSIVGIFIVFKIQIIKSSIENCKQMLIALKVYPSTITEFELMDEKQRNDNYIKAGKGSIQITFKRWDNYDKDIVLIRNNVIWPIICLIIGMVANTLGLILACFINKVFIVELIVLSVIAIFFVYTLVIVYQSIIRILK